MRVAQQPGQRGLVDAPPSLRLQGLPIGPTCLHTEAMGLEILSLDARPSRHRVGQGRDGFGEMEDKQPRQTSAPVQPQADCSEPTGYDGFFFFLRYI